MVPHFNQAIMMRCFWFMCDKCPYLLFAIVLKKKKSSSKRRKNFTSTKSKTAAHDRDDWTALQCTVLFHQFVAQEIKYTRVQYQPKAVWRDNVDCSWQPCCFDTGSFFKESLTTMFVLCIAPICMWFYCSTTRTTKPIRSDII